MMTLLHMIKLSASFTIVVFTVCSSPSTAPSFDAPFSFETLFVMLLSWLPLPKISWLCTEVGSAAYCREAYCLHIIIRETAVSCKARKKGWEVKERTSDVWDVTWHIWWHMKWHMKSASSENVLVCKRRCVFVMQYMYHGWLIYASKM